MFLYSTVLGIILITRFKSGFAIYMYLYTPQPLYNMLHYNMVLGITQTHARPQMLILDWICYISMHFTLVITQIG